MSLLGYHISYQCISHYWSMQLHSNHCLDISLSLSLSLSLREQKPKQCINNTTNLIFYIKKIYLFFL